MNKWAFAAFAVFMWVLPALLAGAFGWSGIWGGGSAFADLILPVPITGGILHVPTFVIALALVKAYPTFDDRSAAIARAALMAALLLGVLQLIDLDRLVQALTTDRQGRAFRLQRNYIGLCMASDALVALSWVLRRPLPRQGWLLTTTIILVPAIFFVMSDYSGLGRSGDPFQYGRQGYGVARGDGELWVYARMRPDDAEFRDSALAFVDQYGPGQRSDTDDLAVYFTDSLQTAKNDPKGAVFRTLCLYEDGTPPQWHEGRADCFSGHLSFTDRLQARVSELHDVLPPDVKMYLIFTEFCEGVEITDQSYVGNSQLEFCHGKDRDEMRAGLAGIYGESELTELLEQAN